MSRYKVIGFERCDNIGDILTAMPALWAIKHLYPDARLVCFTNAFGVNILRYCDFVDWVVDINGGKSFEEYIDEEKIECLILTMRRTHRILEAKRSKARKIITRYHTRSIFSPRFSHPFIIKHQKMREITLLLHYVRKIERNSQNPIMLDFSPIHLKTGQENKDFVESFLNKVKAWEFEKIVLVNAFGKSAKVKGLPDTFFMNLAVDLAKIYPKVLFIMSNFAKNLLQYPEFEEANIVTFINDDDLLNLAQLISEADLLISMDTSLIHFADLARTPTLGLYGYYRTRFRGGFYGGKFDAVYFPLVYDAEKCLALEDSFYKKAKKMISEL